MTRTDLERWRHLAEAAALHGGRHLRVHRDEWRRIETAEQHDVKLAADRMAETLIVARLGEASPFDIVSEETGHISGSGGADADGDLCWLVDPLDGSLNYMRGQPSCCVSIALCRAGDPIVGVIYDFNREELFSGDIDNGAQLNGEPMRVSDIADPAEAVLATGFPSYLDHSEETLSAFVRQVRRYRKVRALGSAALMLAYVGCGRMDAYIERQTALWDVAAGVALVRAAGGRVEMTDGAALDRTLDVTAWNGHFDPA
ncbi:MAG: inositol monophosphatase family protein [Alphaproteobacteria bacterium]